MTTLRTAAQQALEALYQAREHVTVHTDGPWQQVETDCHAAITALLAALAQQAEPVQDVLLSAAGLALDALEHDRQAAARSGRSISMLSSRAIEELRGAFRAALAEPAQEPVQDQRCRAEPRSDGDFVCDCKIGACPGRSAALAQQAEPGAPVPAAVVATQSDVWRGYNGQWAPPGEPIKMVQMLRDLPTGTLLYAAPPRRTMVPLTDEEILKAIGWERAEMYMKLTPNFPVAEAKKETLKNARAIERAHGIGEQP